MNCRPRVQTLGAAWRRHWAWPRNLPTISEAAGWHSQDQMGEPVTKQNCSMNQFQLDPFML